MKKTLDQYATGKKNLLNHFNCTEDYHVNLFTDYHWRVTRDEGVSFLTYWQEGKPPTDALIVNKEGEPIICKMEALTMVVALDCIKIAFILQNSHEV